MPISRARSVAVVMQKRKKAPAPPPAGAGELLAMESVTQETSKPIPVISLFGHKYPVASRWTWEKLLQPVVEKVKA